jgi:hypothetical protein
MCGAMAVAIAGGVISAYGAYEQNEARADEYEASADVYDFNALEYDEKSRIAAKEAQLSKMQGMDTLKRGRIAVHRHETQTRLLVGAQRAAFGASGVRVDTGAPVEVQEDTARMGEADAITLRTNAAKEAFGYDMNAWRQGRESDMYTRQAGMARSSGRSARKNARRTRDNSWISILGSGLNTGASAYGATR